MTVAAVAIERALSGDLDRQVGRRAGGAEPDPCGDVLDPGAPRSFLRAADDQGIDAQTAPHEQRACALRSTELVRGDRAQVDVERTEVDRRVPRGRARVDVDDGAGLARGRNDLGDRLHRPDFVVCELDRHEVRVRAHCVEDLGRVEPSRAVDAGERHFDTRA